MNKYKGRTVKIFLESPAGFKFEGDYLGTEDGFVGILDYRSRKIHLFRREIVRTIEFNFEEQEEQK